MKEKFDSSNSRNRQERSEKQTIGSLSYTIEPAMGGSNALNFEGTFVIGGFVNGEDFRDLIASEARTIRTDAGLCLPEAAELEEENGLVFFTLPRSKIRGVIYNVREGDGVRGDYFVRVATSDVLQDLAAREFPPQKQIERLVRLGRDDEAKKLARSLKRDLDFAIAIKQRDAKKK